MDSNRKLSLPNGSTWKKSTSIALAALLIFSTAVVAWTIAPKNAYAAVSITSSSDTFFGSAFNRVLITDTSLLGSPTDTISVLVEAKRGTTTLGSVSASVDEIGSSGTFELFITTQNLIAGPPTAGNPAAPTSTTTDGEVVRINTAPAGDNDDDVIDLNGGADASPAAELQSGDSIVITYGGSSKTISFSTSSATITTDRAIAGEDNKIVVRIKDQDGNNDPTAVDTITMTTANLEALIGGSQRAVFASGSLTLSETGQNTGEFEGTVTVVTTTGSTVDRVDLSTTPALSLPQGLTFRASDLDVYTPVPAGAVAPFSTAPAPSSPSKVSASVTLQNSDGTISLRTPAKFASGLQIEINDPDRNIDSNLKDTFSTSTLTTGGTLGTTAVVSPIASADTRTVTFSGVTITTAAGDTGGVVTMSMVVTFGADPGTITASVAAPTGTASGITVSGQTAAVTGSGTTRTITLTVPFTTSSTVTAGTLGSFVVTLTQDFSTTATADAASSTFSGTTSRVFVTVDGVPGVLTGLTFEETDKNTGIFRPTATDAKVPISFGSSSSVSSTAITLAEAAIDGDPDIKIVYRDPVGSPTGVKSFALITKLSHTAGTLEGPSSVVGVTDSFTLTLKDADLNTSDKTIETYVVTLGTGTFTSPVTFASGLSGITAKAAGKQIGVATSSGGIVLGTDLTLTFIETGPNTGEFTASNIDMSVINSAVSGGLKDGDRVEFKYTDKMEAPDADSTAQITVGKPGKGVSVDRGTVPVPTSTTADVKIKVTITDPTKNTNTGSTDTFTLADTAISITDSAGAAVTGTPSTKIAGLTSKTFTETGLSTGVFTATYTIGQASGGLSLSLLNGAKIKFTYDDQSSSVTLKAYDGALTTDLGTISNGASIVLRVSDPDANKDPETKETLTVSGETKSDKIESGTLSFTLEETGANTGVFEKKLTVGTDVKVTDLTTTKFATSVEFKYTDAVASDSTTSVTRDLTVKVSTHTGKVSVTPEVVGPGTKVTILVEDADLNANPVGTDITVSGQEYLRITSDRSNANTLTTAVGEETGANTGKFKTTLTLSPFKSTDSASSSFAGTGKDITGKVTPGDIISLRYTDQKDASGNKVTISKTFKVVSVDPEIKATNATTVSTDSSFTFTIADTDANVDGDAVDSVKVRVTSTSDPVGFDVTALETGANTGVFSATVTTTKSVSAGSITVKGGDTISLKYNDKFPADYADRVKQVVDPSKDFVFNIEVGTTLGTKSTTPSAPAVKSVSGQPVTQVLAGSQVVLSTTIKNNLDSSRTYAAIVEVRDSNGITVFLNWQEGTLQANSETGVGLSWTPDQPGTYTTRVFVLSGLTNPQVLSQTVTSTITVS